MKRHWIIAGALLLVTVAAQAQWTRHDITTTLEGGFAVTAGDFDNDGDMDAAGSSSGIVSPTDLRWYENTPDGWVDHLITPGFDGKELVAVDLDQDGDTDIVGVSYSGYVNWWENDNASFTQHTIKWGFTGGYAVDVADINNDGLLDVAGAAASAGDVTWWENTGSDWTEHLLNGVYAGAHGVAIGDISGDGLPDVAASSGGGEDNVTWWENVGGGTWPQFVVDDNQQFVAAVDVADLNQDGYEDIIAADSYGGQILAFMPNGDGTYETEIISSNFPDAWQLCTGDLDGDGDDDIAGVSMWLGVRYWINQGGTFTQHSLINNFGTGRAVQMADMDSDGDLDIIAVNENGYISWWEQPGGSQNPVTLSVNPVNPPVIVPQGGSFEYDVHIVSNLQTTVNGWVWSEAILPNGSTYGPIDQYYLAFTPTTDILATNLTQTIPAMAPLGNYQWRINIGQTLQNPLISDSFGFTVISSAGADGSTTWTPSGWTTQQFAANEPDERNATLPTKFAVGAVYPNPFNANARFDITLPEAQRVSVHVFDTTGRQVAAITNASYSAGTHTLTVAPADLASGVYFLQVKAGPEKAMRKLVLVK